MLTRRFWGGMFCLAMLGLSALAESPVALLVDTRSAVMVLHGTAMKNIGLTEVAIGRYGVTRDKRRGDNMTPLGRYRVAWIRKDGSFGTFIGIDYPSPSDAERGFRTGVINERERRDILRAHRSGKIPPQDTPLGGYLGIHGLGDGDPDVHRLYNWTRGCIAITNEQMNQVLPLITIGTPVVIR